MAVTPKPRLALIIVRPAHATTFDWVRQRYGGKAIIVEDRRVRDRRQRASHQQVRPPAMERRSGGDRRQPLKVSEKHRWREAGYQLVYQRM
jgi:hypothetical protein